MSQDANRFGLWDGDGQPSRSRYMCQVLAPGDRYQEVMLRVKIRGRSGSDPKDWVDLPYATEIRLVELFF